MHEITQIKNLFKGEWLSLEKIEYLDKTGKKKDWESCTRTKSTGAVVIVAITKPSNKFVLIRQFRPPTSSYVIEFPAGLVDEGESSADSALRELKEECGCSGKLIRITNHFFSSPGMSSASLALALVEIDETAPGAFSEPDFDDSEDIETFFVEVSELSNFLSERESLGDKIDAKLATASIFLGMDFQNI